MELYVEDIEYEKLSEEIIENSNIMEEKYVAYPEKELSNISYFSKKQLNDSGIFPSNIIGYVTLKRHKIKTKTIIGNLVDKENNKTFFIYENLCAGKIKGYLPFDNNSFLVVVKQRQSHLTLISLIIATIYFFINFCFC